MTDINIDGIVSWLGNWFQDKLESGVNIKTVNNQSLLGSGNISVSGGGITIDDVYPVGSIYMSVSNTSPQTLFGGTWQQLTNTFLYASTTADTNSTTATGGSADAVVVSHKHSPQGYTYFLATSDGAVTKNSNAGQTGTKVSNLLQQSSGSIARTTTDTQGESGTGKNMPPYMKVYMWKRTA